MLVSISTDCFLSNMLKFLLSDIQTTKNLFSQWWMVLLGLLKNDVTLIILQHVGIMQGCVSLSDNVIRPSRFLSGGAGSASAEETKTVVLTPLVTCSYANLTSVCPAVQQVPGALRKASSSVSSCWRTISTTGATEKWPRDTRSPESKHLCPWESSPW